MACKCGHLPEHHGIGEEFAEQYGCRVKISDGNQCPCTDYRPSRIVDVVDGHSGDHQPKVGYLKFRELMLKQLPREF